MKTELRMVTPAVARSWLKHNTDNRPLRPNIVEGFHIAYSRGEWQPTHQGIAFAKNGRLLDGQHRLTFISQLPDGSTVPINVTTDLDESAFLAIDQGFRRTTSDVLGCSSQLAAVGRFMARIANSSASQGLSIQYVAPFIEWVTVEFEELQTFAPGNAPIWSSAAVRSAAIYQMKRGHDADFIKVSYHSLVNADIDSMPYAARALMQQRMSGRIVSARTLDLFCRALRAFDSKQTKKITSILVKDMSSTLDEVRSFILKETKKGPAVAEPTVAKPAVNSKAKPRRAA